jgi:nicotinate-nucleotide adenylyltransferase
MKRIGLFGGTFNPIHLGHLRAAEEVYESLKLDKVIFIPSHISPHKISWHVPPAEKRLRMVELATMGNPHFGFSDVELRRAGPSFTIDTLRYFTSMHPDWEFHFLLGSDLFQEIETWREWASLFETANFVVLLRPGYTKEGLYRIPSGIKSLFRRRRDEEGSGNVVAVYEHSSTKLLRILRITGIELSSTRIRDLVSAGRSIKYLVTSEVEEYIIGNKLYLGGI